MVRNAAASHLQRVSNEPRIVCSNAVAHLLHAHLALPLSKAQIGARCRRILLLGCLFAAGVSGAGETSKLPTADGEPRFEPAPCPFSAAETAPYLVTCGTVAVVENRAHDDGRRVRLAVAIVHARSAHPESDPVVFLDGGPGQSSLALVVPRLRLSPQVQAILKTRDFIFWDQRSVGLSEPHLCTAPDTE